MSARSRFFPFSEPLPVPSRLISQKTPEATKPLGATMEPEISRPVLLSIMILDQRDGRQIRNQNEEIRMKAETRIPRNDCGDARFNNYFVGQFVTVHFKPEAFETEMLRIRASDFFRASSF